MRHMKANGRGGIEGVWVVLFEVKRWNSLQGLFSRNNASFKEIATHSVRRGVQRAMDDYLNCCISVWNSLGIQRPNE